MIGMRGSLYPQVLQALAETLVVDQRVKSNHALVHTMLRLKSEVLQSVAMSSYLSEYEVAPCRRKRRRGLDEKTFYVFGESQKEGRGGYVFPKGPFECVRASYCNASGPWSEDAGRLTIVKQTYEVITSLF